jgi:hypothetical protein
MYIWICPMIHHSMSTYWHHRDGPPPQNEYDILIHIQMLADLAMFGLNPVYFAQTLVLFLRTMWLASSFQKSSEWQFQEFCFYKGLINMCHMRYSLWLVVDCLLAEMLWSHYLVQRHWSVKTTDMEVTFQLHETNPIFIKLRCFENLREHIIFKNCWLLGTGSTLLFK